MTTFALMLLRVLILRAEETDSVKQCLEWIQDQLTATSCQQISTPAARSMAWLTMANAAGSKLLFTSLSQSTTDMLVEAGLADLGEAQPRVEVRQAVAAFLYNTVLHIGKDGTEDELSDVAVSLLCSSLESLASEVDATTRLRRLMVVGRIVKPYKPNGSGTVHGPAKNLVNDLGFVDSLESLTSASAATTGNADDGKRCKELAGELICILQ